MRDHLRSSHLNQAGPWCTSLSAGFACVILFLLLFLLRPLCCESRYLPEYPTDDSNCATMLLSTLLFAGLAQAMPQGGGGSGFTMLRFGCSQVSIDRIDPLVNPGQAPSPHMHQIVGGNAFNVTMASTDIAKLASCTTCGYSEDVS